MKNAFKWNWKKAMHIILNYTIILSIWDYNSILQTYEMLKMIGLLMHKKR